MLDEIKKNYEQVADLIPNWREMNKNDLCNLYIEHENDSKGEIYLAAIVSRYWNKINTFYLKNKLSATIEDCYDWLIEAILYALSKRRWLSPDSSLYNDPNGPDKAINIKMKCLCWNHTVYLNRMKRKINKSIVSIDDDNYYNYIISNISDSSFTAYTYETDQTIKSYIQALFNSNEYVLMLMIYILITTEETDTEKIKTQIMNFSELEIKNMSNEFELNYNKLKDIILAIKSISSKELKEKIELNNYRLQEIFKKLSNDTTANN